MTEKLSKIKQSFLKNSSLIITSGGMVFFQGVNFLIGIFLAQHLTVGEVGKFQLLVSLVTIVAIAAKLGLEEGCVFYLAKVEKSGITKLTFILYNLVLAVISAVLIAFIIKFSATAINQYFIAKVEFGYELSIIYIWYMPVFVFYTMIVSLLKALELFNFRAVLTYFIFPLFFISGLYIYNNIYENLDLTFVYSIRIIGYTIVGIIGTFKIFTYVKGKVNISSLSKKFLLEYHSFSITVIFIILIQFMAEQPIIDLMLLSNITSDAQVGIYSINYKVATLMMVVFAAFNVVYTPKLARYYEGRQIDLLKSEFIKTRKWMMIFSIGFLAVLMIGYDLIIGFFGEEYTAGRLSCFLLIIGFASICFGGLNSTLLLVSGNKQIELYINVISVLVLVIVGYVAIINYGIIGIAAVNLFIFSASTLVKVWFCQRILGQLT